MSDTTATSANTNSASSITIKSNTPIKPDDFDFLIMFLESKRQSGGGDIAETTQIDPRTVKIAYESSEAAERVLRNRFFKFKNYNLRVVFDANNNGIMRRMFERDNTKLIIKNLNIFDANTGHKDNDIAKLYAEHLVNEDNNVTQIEILSFFKETFYVSYERAIDHAFLQKRYEKRSIVRDRKVTLLDAYLTNSYLVFAKKSKATRSAKKLDLYLVKSAIVGFIRNIKQSDNEPVPFFVETTSNYILIEFKDKPSDSMLQNLKKTLVDLDRNLEVEYLPSYELLKDIDDTCLDCFEASNANTPSNHPTKQTIKAEKSASSETTAQLVLHKIFLNNSMKTLSVCMNSFKQLFISLQQFLSSKSQTLKLKYFKDFKTGYRSYFVEESSKQTFYNWRVSVQKWLNEFVRNEKIDFKSINLVTDKASKSVEPGLLDLLTEKVNELNRSKNKTAHLEFSPDNRYLFFYGVTTNLPQCLAYIRDEISKFSQTAEPLAQLKEFVTEPLVVKKDLAHVDINPNSFLYLSLLNFETCRSDFKQKVRTLYSDLCVKDKKIFVRCDFDDVWRVEELIKSFEHKPILKLSEVAMEEYLNPE